jgi:hypothetical protein
MVKRILYIFLFSFLIFNVVHGQLGTDVSSLVLTVTPERPRANQTVTIKLESYAVNLDSSSIIWYLNDKLAIPDSSRKVLTINSGNYGETQTVRVVIVSSGGQTFDKIITINPSEINLLWQSNTYTPPFYKGKALFTVLSDVTFIAMPSSGGYQAKDLIYTWRKDGVNIPDSGGLGANTVNIPSHNFLAQPITIAVEAHSSDYKYSAFDFITLDPGFPKVLIYEKSPLYGVRFEKALQNTQVSLDEITMEVYPYFFSTTNRFLENTNVTWRINNSTISEAKDRKSIIIKRNGTNAMSLDVKINHKDKVLQTSTQKLNLSFTENQ